MLAGCGGGTTGAESGVGGILLSFDFADFYLLRLIELGLIRLPKQANVANMSEIAR